MFERYAPIVFRSAMSARLREAIEIFNESAAENGWRAQMQMDAPMSGVFRRGLRTMEHKGHVLVAICLNNGYYNRENIHRLVKFAAPFSDHATIFFTDGPSIHNYLAYGLSADQGRREIRKQKMRLMNACLSGLEAIAAREKFSFLEWPHIYDQQGYKIQFEYLSRLYLSNAQFRDDLQAETKRILARKNIADEVALTQAVRYPLEELAFLLSFDPRTSGLPSGSGPRRDFAYIYHMRWPLFENVVDGHYDGVTRSHIGFALVQISSHKTDVLGGQSESEHRAASLA